MQLYGWDSYHLSTRESVIVKELLQRSFKEFPHSPLRVISHFCLYNVACLVDLGLKVILCGNCGGYSM